MDLLNNNLPFFPKMIKIENIEKIGGNFHGKEEYFICIRNLKQASNHRLVS